MGLRLPTDSLKVIIHFATVADERSFTEAAGQLGITRSTIGKSSSHLEGRLESCLVSYRVHWKHYWRFNIGMITRDDWGIMPE
ncbi:TPA: LysR family transcriptional regulator [Kluyvera georgiana]|nr:LysR family transcriptional regulator [Kluyvera georgiana]